VLNAARLVGLLADPTRMRVLSAIALGAEDDAAIVAATGLTTKDVLMARQRLTDAGLLDGWQVRYDALRALAKEQTTAEPADEATPRALGAFLRHGRLLGMPAQHGRRLQLLQLITATTFEDGELYTEAEVNERLMAWCEGGPVDHVTVRRYLIDAQLLVRGDGTYQLPSPDSSPDPNLGEVYVRALGLS
jgi:hypothetical protein